MIGRARMLFGLASIRRRVLAFMAALEFLGCAAHDRLWGQASTPDEIRAAVWSFVAAINQSDVSAVADAYVRVSAATSVTNTEVTRGWGAIADLVRDALRGEPVRMHVDSLEITPLGDDIGVALLSYVIWIGDPNTEPFQRGVQTQVWVRTPDGWRIVHDHTSAVDPGRTGGLSAAPPGPPVGPTQPCRVALIVDGNTFLCHDSTRVRLTGIDSPGLSQAPFGRQAAEALAEWLPAGTSVGLEADVDLEDRFAQRLAYVWRDTVLVNWNMIEQGWAVALTIPPNVRYARFFADAQRAAREGGRGLWGTGGFDCRRQDRRERRC